MTVFARRRRDGKRVEVLVVRVVVGDVVRVREVVVLVGGSVSVGSSRFIDDDDFEGSSADGL